MISNIDEADDSATGHYSVVTTAAEKTVETVERCKEHVRKRDSQKSRMEKDRRAGKSSLNGRQLPVATDVN